MPLNQKSRRAVSTSESNTRDAALAKLAIPWALLLVLLLWYPYNLFAIPLHALMTLAFLWGRIAANRERKLVATSLTLSVYNVVMPYSLLAVALVPSLAFLARAATRRTIVAIVFASLVSIIVSLLLTTAHYQLLTWPFPFAGV